MSSNPIISPAPFVASYAVAFADQNGAAHNVSQASPLPVALNTTSAMQVTVSYSQPLSVSGNVTVANTGSSPLPVSGSVTVSNSSSSPLPVSGNVTVTNSGTNPLSVSVSNSQPLPVSGSVTVANSSGTPLAVSGGVTISNSSASPVPVNTQAVASTPLTGTASSSATVGPFSPVVGRAVMLALTGSWVGSAEILRSTNGGTTMLPLTMGGATWGLYTSNCCEPVWDESEASAQLYLQLSLTSGSVTYRLAQ